MRVVLSPGGALHKSIGTMMRRLIQLRVRLTIDADPHELQGVFGLTVLGFGLTLDIGVDDYLGVANIRLFVAVPIGDFDFGISAYWTGYYERLAQRVD